MNNSMKIVDNVDFNSNEIELNNSDSQCKLADKIEMYLNIENKPF